VSWNPDQYLKFSAPRLRPALDLLAAVPATQPKQVFDLGCGTGNVTRVLASRWPQACVTGVDDSAPMLAEASAEPSTVRWVERGLTEWRADRPADLIFSNAALHWLPDHERLFPALQSQLAPCGVLAVQMPRNFDAPSHALIADTVCAGPWRRRLEPLLRPSPVAPPDFYYRVLASRAASVDVWETEYLQVLDGPDPVKEWTKGTWLKQFLDALGDVERVAFEDDYAARLRTAYPVHPDGKTLFPFRRLFIVATAPS
jgi:trans-aconitate 2-methyltransferase